MVLLLLNSFCVVSLMMTCVLKAFGIRFHLHVFLPAHIHCCNKMNEYFKPIMCEGSQLLLIRQYILTAHTKKDLTAL